jgi:DNA polymerase I-like protein with 3'-5' exonuclease and polymerase domains
LQNDKEYVQKIIKDAMISISSSDYHMFSIPLNVSINSGLNWEEAH